ncbi:MAG TPA: recombinase family protein [Puia sp.]|nr:recombinase family protein [Puia sp.]
MEKYVGYARTSTGRQVLGLEEQDYRLRQYVQNNGELIEIIVEQESGKNNERKGLERAMTLCQKFNYTLLFTRLDRLSREVEFLFALRNRGVKLTCIELPELNTLTLGIFGSVAQWERELISSRTKRGLAELKKKGVKLGSPQNFTQAGRDLGLQVIKENRTKNVAWNKAKTYIDHYFLKYGKMNFSKVAAELNNNGYKTRNGNLFTPMTVKRLFES